MITTTMGRRVRYGFDNLMSKGPAGLIGWLFLVSALVALVTSLAIKVTGSSPEPAGFWDLTWRSMQKTLGISAATGSMTYVLVMFLPTFGGMFVGATLIGVLTGAIQNKLFSLRKGRSFVAERDHTVILGWSQQVFPILSELVIANANRRHSAIVVLAEKDKVEMEDAIRARIGPTGRTRIVVRTGSPLDLCDLGLVNPNEARAFVLLAPDAPDPDAHVLKTLLALSRIGGDGRRRNVVAELRDPKNLGVAELASGGARLLLVDDLVARITVQCCRQAGLSAVYGELLDFSGDEMYVHEEPRLVGRTFGAALSAYEGSALVGLVREGRSLFNPAMDTRIEPGDKVIAISEDDDTIRLSDGPAPEVDLDSIGDEPVPPRRAERTLVLGWNRRAPMIIGQLDAYVAPGSSVVVVAELPGGQDTLAARCPALENQALIHRAADTTDRAVLDALDVPGFDHVITLGDSDRLGPQEADARTLVTLLHLRDIATRTGHAFSIVSEMLDERNRSLAEVARADDFIVSDKLVSEMLAQMAENPELSFSDLLDAAGSELYLRPARSYVRVGEPVSFYTVVEAGRRRGEVAIGYRLIRHADEASRHYGVKLNPPKSVPITFCEQDRIIVLAEA